MAKKIKNEFVKSNAHKTKWFAIWRYELTLDELLSGAGEKANSKSFNSQNEAEQFLSNLKNS